MTRAYVVIGANLGDEGKGLVTDYLARQTNGNATVIRFNGGAQAAHTVQLPSGHRHVFHHIGSGSFSGARTYLSSYFLCNPLLFEREWNLLHKEGLSPRIAVDPDAPVTTPYDMMINQIAEQQRGAQRHGSCGTGIGETIERHYHSPHSLTVRDCLNEKTLLKKLAAIQKHWVKPRLNALGIRDIAPEWTARLCEPAIVQHFLHTVRHFLHNVTLTPVERLDRNTTFVFEGAQGLLLDQNHDWFPHVTRSNTGLKNVIPLAKKLGITALETVYVTRCYLTRHGAGPLPFELPNIPYKNVTDITNIPNLHQGSLRFAWLNIDLLKQSVWHDIREAQGDDIEILPRLAVTCLDQADETLSYVLNDTVHQADENGFLNTLTQEMDIICSLCSYGPAAKDVVPYQECLTRAAYPA